MRKQGAATHSPQIEVKGASVRIERLTFSRGDVATYFLTRPKNARPEAAIRALEIGVFCLERVKMAHDIEFVRREIQSLLHEVDSRTKRIAPDIQEQLARKLGAGPGQLLAPIASAVGGAQTTLKQRLDEIRQLLDPSNKKSDLSQVLEKIRGLLDADRKGSIQDTFREALAALTRENGHLGSFVHRRVAEAIKPLSDQITQVYDKIVGDLAARNVIEATTAKGRPYEDQVTEWLGRIFSAHGITVERVGTDNHPGDVVLTFPPSGAIQRTIRVVVEARDRVTRYGHKRIADDLETAMQHRKCDAAVYVAHTGNGLASEIGDWGEGRTQRGPYVATAHEGLPLAVRWVVAQLRLEGSLNGSTAIDFSALQPHLQRVRTALRRLATIHRYIKDGDGAFKGIAGEADALRDEVRDALRHIEDGLRLPVPVEQSEAEAPVVPLAIAGEE